MQRFVLFASVFLLRKKIFTTDHLSNIDDSCARGLALFHVTHDINSTVIFVPRVNNYLRTLICELLIILVRE